MFSPAAYSAVHFARRTVLATLCKQARFLSVGTVSSTKNFYSESVLLSEKPGKATQAKKNNEDKLEQSQLYPDEWKKFNNYDLMEFDLLMDDSKTSSMPKDSRSDKLDSVAGKFEAVDKMPSLEGVRTLAKPESVERKSEAVKVGIFEAEEIDQREDDVDERQSDSDSGSDSDARDITGGMRKKVFPNTYVNLNNLNIKRLEKRSRFFRKEMEKACSRMDGMVFNDEIGGIVALAKMGVAPEALFFCSAEALRLYPGDLSKISLYKIPLEDMRYWASSVRNISSAMIGLYREENFRIKTDSSEPEMPVTIILDWIWHRIGFAHIINSVYMAPPKHFVTSKDCANPWHGIVLRNSIGHGMSLNHDFGLTWEEIREKVDETDRVYLLELAQDRDGRDDTELRWSSLPSVNLYDHSFWNGKDIALIVAGSNEKRASKELSSLCLERKALRIDAGVEKKPVGLTPFHMVFFEMRRQWLAAGKRKSGSKNGKTTKSRVRIVSTLFKT